VRPAVPEVVLAADVPVEDLQRRLRRGTLVRVGRGAYAPPCEGFSPHDTALHLLLCRAAAVHARRTGEHWFSHTTAAVLWGCSLVTVPRHVDVTGPVRRRAVRTNRSDGVRDHFAAMSTGDVSRSLVLPTTSLERTVVDCAATLPGAHGLAVADSGLRAGADPAELRRIVERRAGSPGIRRARLVLGMADARAESVGESRLRWVLAASGSLCPDLQVPVRTADRWRWVDLGWREERVAVEFDGRVKYGTDGRAAADALFQEKRRQHAIEDEGWTVLRVTWPDLDRPVEVVQRVRRALRSARRRRG
jgi:very-short-patch-repair endonuclease/predicted transcriptional regulator of viral defense system